LADVLRALAADQVDQLGGDRAGVAAELDAGRVVEGDRHAVHRPRADVLGHRLAGAGPRPRLAQDRIDQRALADPGLAGDEDVDRRHAGVRALFLGGELLRGVAPLDRVGAEALCVRAVALLIALAHAADPIPAGRARQAAGPVM